jgi:hypothetical protein
MLSSLTILLALPTLVLRLVFRRALSAKPGPALDQACSALAQAQGIEAVELDVEYIEVC